METPKAKLQSSHLPSSHVRVVLRVRPFLPSEIEKDGRKPSSCVSLLDQLGNEVTVHLKDQWTSRNECYKLDSFFGQEDVISQIFHKEVSSVIPGIFHGLNATVFAYGATGSGKTFTMQGTENEPGLIRLAMSAILSLSKGMQSSVDVSFYEVYMDKCYDLLEPKAKEIMALDDKNGRVQLKGLSWVPVCSMDGFCEVFSSGVQRRKVAHTSLNDVSSRSHAVLAIAIKNGARKGKLNLIDLAGNEDNRRTCNEGIRLQESVKINKSLFALSNVIYALNNNEPRVPYRESKLTRILQDSLGGDSRALMIACLNPGSYQEAIHTVSLAARSRQIINYVGSAKRKENPTEVIDMEAKLRVWLESKGKTKSIQRMNGVCSPPFHRTPALVSYSKNEPVSPTNKGRKLFDSGTYFSYIVQDDGFSSNSSAIPEDVNSKETICARGASGCSKQPKDVNCKESICTRGDGFSSNSSVIPEDVKSKESICTRGASGCSEQPKVANTNHKNETCINGNIEDAKDFEEKTIERIQKLQSPLRKVLSQINPCNNQTSGDSIFSVVLDLKSPKTPFSSANKWNEYETSTPIDKFNVLSSNLKESLLEEYISFLNIASKQELMQLKGIGKKRAECILELREKSPRPIKSLSDLEQIGLSSKQVHDLLKRGARGIFT